VIPKPRVSKRVRGFCVLAVSEETGLLDSKEALDRVEALRLVVQDCGQGVQ